MQLKSPEDDEFLIGSWNQFIEERNYELKQKRILWNLNSSHVCINIQWTLLPIIIF